MNTGDLKKTARHAKEASAKLAILSTDAKKRALKAMARALVSHRGLILRENAKDVRAAVKNGLSSSLIGRL